MAGKFAPTMPYDRREAKRSKARNPRLRAFRVRKEHRIIVIGSQIFQMSQRHICSKTTILISGIA